MYNDQGQPGQADLPPEPQYPTTFNAAPELIALRERVIEALFDLPAYFESRTDIHDVDVTDLIALNSALGASIEKQVVRVLNQQRERWDDGAWAGYKFVRYSQTFPDVRLERPRLDAAPQVAFGVELKGWYLLSKELEPSYRFQAAVRSCAELDILAVVPWHFDEVVSGTPTVLSPYIEPARWLAEARNYWWEYVRNSRGPVEQRGVRLNENARPYPAPKSEMHDVPIADGGGNFGRLARISLPKQRPDGVMADFVAQANQLELLGVPVELWLTFLKANIDGKAVSEVKADLARKLDSPDTDLRDLADNLMAVADIISRRLGD